MKHLKLTFLLAVLMSMVGAKLFAYDANVNGIYYNLSDNEATVTYYSLYESQNKNAYYGIIEIPSFIIYNEKTYNVTSIGEQAFFGCSGLTSVTIPNSVTTILSNAFNGCNGLVSITIPESVTSIGAAAFFGCTGLTSVIIQESVTTIGSSAFNSCSALASINFPNSLISVGGAAFDETGWYNNQPDGVVYAGKVVYKYKGTMPSNTSITLKKGTVGITVDAFYSSSGLTSINIPNSVTYISDGAFFLCI